MSASDQPARETDVPQPIRATGAAPATSADASTPADPATQTGRAPDGAKGSWSRRGVLGLGAGGALAWLAACTSTPTVTITPTSGVTGATGATGTATGATSTGAGPTVAPSTTATGSATVPSGEPVAPVPPPPGTLHALLLGSDSRSESLRPASSDVITLVQLTADRSRVNLVSVARDTLVAYPWGGRGKVNAIYARGGPTAAATAISQLLGGIPIEYVVETGFTRFIRLSELLGGFTVANRRASSSIGIPFPEGPVRLQGEPSLLYVRERKGLPNGDLDRTERHRAALTGMLLRMQQLAAQPGVLERLVPLLMGQVESAGFTAGQAEALVPVVRSIAEARVFSAMVPIARFGMVGGASVDLVDEARLGQLVQGLRMADLSSYVARYGVSTTPSG